MASWVNPLSVKKVLVPLFVETENSKVGAMRQQKPSWLLKFCSPLWLGLRESFRILVDVETKSRCSHSLWKWNF